MQECVLALPLAPLESACCLREDHLVLMSQDSLLGRCTAIGTADHNITWLSLNLFPWGTAPRDLCENAIRISPTIGTEVDMWPKLVTLHILPPRVQILLGYRSWKKEWAPCSVARSRHGEGRERTLSPNLVSVGWEPDAVICNTACTQLWLYLFLPFYFPVNKTKSTVYMSLSLLLFQPPTTKLTSTNASKRDKFRFLHKFSWH